MKNNVTGNQASYMQQHPLSTEVAEKDADRQSAHSEEEPLLDVASSGYNVPDGSGC